jgi:hypothetical protein
VLEVPRSLCGVESATQEVARGIGLQERKVTGGRLVHAGEDPAGHGVSDPALGANLGSDLLETALPRATSASLAPLLASSSANVRPSPRLAPVMSAAFPWSFMTTSLRQGTVAAKILCHLCQ